MESDIKYEFEKINNTLEDLKRDTLPELKRMIENANLGEIKMKLGEIKDKLSRIEDKIKNN